jgi:hypothetical protein
MLNISDGYSLFLKREDNLDHSPSPSLLSNQVSIRIFRFCASCLHLSFLILHQSPIFHPFIHSLLSHVSLFLPRFFRLLVFLLDVSIAINNCRENGERVRRPQNCELIRSSYLCGHRNVPSPTNA